jgi:hypothetical protein
VNAERRCLEAGDIALVFSGDGFYLPRLGPFRSSFPLDWCISFISSNCYTSGNCALVGLGTFQNLLARKP